MGIYDRDYYRDDGGGWWASMAGRQATVGLMIATGSIFLLQLMTSGGRGAVSPVTLFGQFSYSAVLDGEIWRFVTSMFVHPTNSLWPVAMNLLVLFWVGTSVEAIYGTREFLTFYLTAGVTATVGRFALVAGGFVDPKLVELGAAGPMTAALVVYACHYPYNTVMLFFVIPVPVWLLVSGVVGLQLLGALGVGSPSPALIGAAFGLLYYNRQVRLSTLWSGVSGRLARRRQPRLSVYRGEQEPQPVGAEPRPARNTSEATGDRPVDEHLEAKLDAVLEKVSRFGKESLSSEEHQILLRASEIYKRRRES
jgi:membrane associated rhomboid family serine protease